MRQCDRDAATRSRGSSGGPGYGRPTSNQNRSTKRTSTQCKTQRKQPSKSFQLEEFQFFWPFWMSSWRDFTCIVGNCPKISLIVKCSGPKALSGRLFFSNQPHCTVVCEFLWQLLSKCNWLRNRNGGSFDLFLDSYPTLLRNENRRNGASCECGISRT